MGLNIQDIHSIKKSLHTCFHSNHCEDVSPFLNPSPWGQKPVKAIRELQRFKYFFGVEENLTKGCNEQEGQGQFVVLKIQRFCVKTNKTFQLYRTLKQKLSLLEISAA